MADNDIKEGDIFYLQVSVGSGWGDREDFWLPHKVTRVTPKQFFIGDKRFRKDNLKMIGDRYIKAARHGDSDWGDVVTDQSSEHKAYIENLRVARKIQSMLYDLGRGRVNGKVKPDTKGLRELLQQVTTIHERLTNGDD